MSQQVQKIFGHGQIGLAACAASDLGAFIERLTIANKELAVRLLRGERMKTEEDALGEFAAAWQFPWYYGSNWDAFDECITDLAWIEASAFMNVILNPDVLLIESTDDALAFLLRHLLRAEVEWSTPVERSEPWDRPPRWFGTLLHCTPERARTCKERFATIGTPVVEVEITKAKDLSF